MSKQTEDAIGISIIIFLVIVGIVGCVLIEKNKPDENKILQSKLKNHEIVIDSAGHKWNYTCISGKGYLKTFFNTNTNYQAVIIEDPSTEYAKCK